MSNPTVTYSFTSGTTITASEVNTNFSDLISWISGGNIDSTHIAASAITASELAADAVTTAKILDANVTTAKLASGAVTTAKITAGAVTTTELGADAVTSAKIADGAIDTAAQIANDLIDSQHYAAGSIDTEHFAAGVVTEAVLDTLPACKAKRSTAQTLTTGVSAAISYTGTDEYDTDTMHDTVTNPSRITVPVAGIYTVMAHVKFEANTTGRRIVGVDLNGSNVSEIGLSDAIATTQQEVVVVWEGLCAANDYLEITAYQDSGGNLNVETSWFSVRWVGRVA